MLQLTILKGPTGVGSQFNMEIGRPLIIGRAEGADILLAANGISKKHCQLTLLPGSRVEVEDLGSSNGTFVNGLLVRKHILKVGDTLTLNPFILQLGITAPQAQPGYARGGTQGAFTVPTDAPPPAPTELTGGQKAQAFLANSVYPVADNLSGRFDLRFLVFLSFIIWSVLIVVFTASPFANKANERVTIQAVETARLYARQLARINQQFVIDQRYTDLVAELDSRPGQTLGITRSLILDAVKAQILAPPALIGQNLPDKYARIAISQDNEHVQFDEEDFAYVSVPIKIGTADGNRIAAVAFVEYDVSKARFSVASIVDQAISSILYALLASFLLLIFVYRWLEGSLDQVSAKLDEAMKKSEVSIVSPVKWPAMAQLCEQISFALGRAAGGSGGAAPGSGAWAQGAVALCGNAAASFDTSLVVTAWNGRMEQVIGIRATLAVGSDISGASRDLAFESTVRELAAETGPQNWVPGVRDIEFSGNFYKIAMIHGDGAYLVSIVRKEE